MAVRRQTAGLALIATAAAAAVVMQARRRSVRSVTFRNDVVVISGGSRGFGLAIARQFASEGARIVILARERAELERAAIDLSARAGNRVMTVVCDVRQKSSVDAAVDAILGVYGRIDVLVNNAGVIQTSPLEHVQLEDYRESLDTHFWGPVHLIHACLPQMLARRGGRIVNVASIGGRVSIPHLSAYCAGKFALVGLSEGMHAELKARGIRVTTVTPSLMRTGSHRNVRVRGQHRREAIWFALASSTPLSSMSAYRAAEMVVEAVRAGRARVSPGWQGRSAELAQVMWPEGTARLLAWVSSRLLPGASRPPGAVTGEVDGDEARWSRDLDTGRVARLFPTAAARRFNQPVAADEGGADAAQR